VSWLNPFKEHNDYVDKTDAKLRGAFSIGERFEYLGRTCIVTGYGWGEMDIGWIPRLMCDYADELGVIRHIQFRPHEVDALIASLGKSVATSS
jgi:hypothetical protein